METVKVVCSAGAVGRTLKKARLGLSPVPARGDCDGDQEWAAGGSEVWSEWAGILAAEWVLGDTQGRTPRGAQIVVLGRQSQGSVLRTDPCLPVPR